MKVKRVGQAGAIKQPSAFSFDPKTGFQNEVPFRGSPEAVLGYAAQLTAAGIAYRYRSDGQIAEVTLVTSAPVDGSDEKPIDNWQLLGNELQKDVLSHPTIAAAEDDRFGTIAAIIANNRKYEDTDPGETPEVVWPDWLSGAGPEKLFLELLNRKITHFAVAQYVLRHTRTVSNQYSKDIPDENAQKLYTTAQLITECADAGLSYPLPKRLENKISAIPEPESQVNFLWSWRKIPSTETTVAGDRIEVVTEYWLDQWSTVLYEVLS